MKHFSYILSVLLIMACPLFSQNATHDDYEGLSIDDQLMVAADKDDSVKALSLIEKGANVNAATWEGITSLMYAAQRGNINMVRLLIRHGAKVDTKPYAGFTALISSIRGGYPETAEYLIRHGADINLSDNDNVTPLMYAIAADSFYMPDMLIYYGASLDAKTKKGVDALMMASFHNRLVIASELLEAGAEINSKDADGNTPLHYATYSGSIGLMDLLIANGASVETRNASGYTPLSLAVSQNNYAAVRLLIGDGADVNSPVNRYLNPMVLAKNNRNDSIIRILTINGAEIIKHPSFNQFALGVNYSFNKTDSQLGFGLGLHDRRYGIMPMVGFGFRPRATQVLANPEKNVYYQYWERRYYLNLSVDKSFFKQYYGSRIYTAAFAGVGETFSFGSYKGSGNNPQSRFMFTPKIGCMAELGSVRIKVGYQYMDTHLPEFGKYWCNISMEFLFNQKKGYLKAPSMVVNAVE